MRPCRLISLFFVGAMGPRQMSGHSVAQQRRGTPNLASVAARAQCPLSALSRALAALAEQGLDVPEGVRGAPLRMELANLIHRCEEDVFSTLIPAYVVASAKEAPGRARLPHIFLAGASASDAGLGIAAPA